jgi:hypothetical protein
MRYQAPLRSCRPRAAWRALSGEIWCGATGVALWRFVLSDLITGDGGRVGWECACTTRFLHDDGIQSSRQSRWMVVMTAVKDWPRRGAIYPSIHFRSQLIIAVVWQVACRGTSLRDSPGIKAAPEPVDLGDTRASV